MIQLKKKNDCCGCNACTQICPKQCITMKEDLEGFLYPEINQKECIECNLCEKVCPVINQYSPSTPSKIFGIKNKKERVRLQSSSGGIFTILAEKVLENGGVVFGARFNENWEVVHDFIDNKADISQFQGSKYVQSQISNSFKQVQIFLKQQKLVLFSGTPCQIAGLKRFLRKKYENLITVDFICHGVPSPKVWRLYLDEICNKIFKCSKSNIKSICFRNKTNGWRNFSLQIQFYTPISYNGTIIREFRESNNDNLFMKGFLRDLYLRPSCHSCPTKAFKSGSDYTIADFWGIEKTHPDFYDNIGISILFVNGEKDIFPYEKCDVIESRINKIIKYNPAIIKCALPKRQRSLFFQKINNQSSINLLIDKYSRYSIKEKINNIINKILTKL